MSDEMPEIENLEIVEDEPENEEIAEPMPAPIKGKKPRKQLSEADSKKRLEYLSNARMKQKKYMLKGKEVEKLEKKPKIKEEIIQEHEEDEEETEIETLPLPVKTKKKAVKYYDQEEEELSERDIKEYLRFKRNEENDLKRAYLLKNQKNQENRYKMGMMTMFN